MKIILMNIIITYITEYKIRNAILGTNMSTYIRFRYCEIYECKIVRET